MKKLMSLLLALTLLLSLAACSTYSEGTMATRETLVEINPDDVDPEGENTSSVTLLLNGLPITENEGFYALYQEMEIYAQWSDGYTMVVSKFDENGVALATGLDGDFSVTLSDVPGDYTYNINGYTTTNDNRRIELNLYRILYGDGPGTDVYYPYIREFSDEGVYEIEITSPDDMIYCRFAPEFSGIYTIESWVSVAEDNVNPKYDYWYGTPAWAQYGYTINDGGAEGLYTKNFKDVRTVTEDEIGNVFIFGIHATAKDDQYPIKVYVSILKTAEMGERYDEVFMVPTDLRYAKEGSGQLLDFWQPQSDGSYLLDESKCRLWTVEEGGDGFYHIYDEALYAANGGWGPTLYARIKTPSLTGYAVYEVEWLGNGNKMLSLRKGDVYYRYKQFIEGFNSLSSIHDGWGGSNYCINSCPCHKNDSAPIVWACEEGCEKCDPLCTQVPTELYGMPGYADAVNSDGVYPVNQELKDFLQLYAECHNLFCDGTGDLEKEGLNSDQNSMWLWAVCYYSGDQGGVCKMGERLPLSMG